MSDPTLAILGVIAAASALYAISAQQLMRGVLGLAIFFLALAGIFGILGAWYLAVGQLFLFVGGVVTLFVLAFNFTRTPLSNGKGVVAAFICMVALAALTLYLPPSWSPATAPTLEQFGTMFFTQYGWVLNIALLLLFAAVMGAQYFMEDT